MLRTQTRTMDAWDIVSGTAKALLPEPAIDLARKVRDRRRARRALAGYLARIGAAFPDVSYRSAWLIDEGNDYAIVNLDDSLVFRFPRNGDSADLKREVRLLENLRARTSISVPNYLYMTDTFGGYPMLQGRPLDVEVLRNLNESETETVLTQLASFLSALHSTEHDIIARADGSVPHTAPHQLFADGYYGEQRDRLESLVDTDLRRSLERFYAESPLPDAPRLRLVHGDLKPSHVFLLPESHQLAVIDFGDVSAADPAIDFTFLWFFGEDCARSVFERYSLASEDPEIVERARQLLPRLGVKRLLWRFANPQRYSPDQQAKAITLLRQELAAAGFADGH